jgi:endonuclease/exonuclease/phosphatase (EEP) superfamily protein YafD
VQADIVAVQELTTRSVAILAADLAADYPYQILEPAVASTGLFSKLPIVSYQWLSPPGGRPFLHVVVDHDGANLHVFPVHFYPPGIVWSEPFHLPRGIVEIDLEREVAYLLQQVAGVSGPVVVLGDFNMSDQSRAYSTMTTSLQDGFRQAGFGLGLTFPNNFRLAGVRVPIPLVRIDYVFHSPHMKTISATVNCIEGQSDHCAVLAVLRAIEPGKTD